MVGKRLSLLKGENMDRYLYKAKRLDNGGWVVWNIFSGLYGADIDKSTICQCTGLKIRTEI